jgi:DHA3 family macrolide efflux protein-like MFS transporter
MQGRVFSLLGAISAAATPLGLIIAGPLADSFGISILYFIAGTATLILCITGASIPSVMSLGSDAEDKKDILKRKNTEIIQ